MKTKSFLANTVIALSLLAGSVPVLAGGGDVCDKDARQAASSSPGHGEKPLRRLIERLDLSPAQRERINTIVAGQRNTLLNKRQSLRDIHQQLYRAASHEDYDAAQVDQLLEQQSRLAAEMTAQRTDMVQKIYQQITPQQQATFQSMRHRHHRG
ncbi:Spy/CpxP family protein refolding chaperone [Thiohalophilus thiocyanatoxydans]|uniref:Signaling pathway modulator ZraP n=1 Tax=Thiohalophilus thiocyanatoxydans TaxID=381308 RepID=A0A4R8ITE7_9GAMM|nr:Spy/CpxP family protein refolding chaperone [Thiohalophilus thiocyanatoxydans]TDY00523.1 heavy-metal resistance protein [Thiohalophilus thiocyanatoxydans]